ncbi:MAG: 3-hydroxyacyl-CoA dehydrogenase, partial [Pseudomonadota bacterium]
YQASGDCKKAAWNTWMQVGYVQTGSSPDTSANLQYFLSDRDREVANRDKLITEASRDIEAMIKGYSPPEPMTFELPGIALLDEMASFMDDGIEKGMFFPHDKTTAMAVASIVVSDTAAVETASEQDLYDRERRAFLSLAKTPQTHARISAMLDEGAPIRN